MTIRRRLALLLAVMSALSCGEEGLELSVDLRTDFLPGRQFVGTRLEVFTADHVRLDVVDAVATAQQDYLDGLRVADIRGLRLEDVMLRTTLLAPSGRVLAARETVVELDDDLAVTVVVTSSCQRVACPEVDGDPTRTSCVGGICVDPRCTPESQDQCFELGCSADEHCGAASDCTTGVCIDGWCFYRPEPEMCGDGWYCDIDEGCVVDPTFDASVPIDVGASDLGMSMDVMAAMDAGVDAGNAMSDAGPLGERCTAEETACGDGIDNDCDGQIDCLDTDCEAVACDEPSAGEWGPCEFDGVCATTGAQTREHTTYACAFAECQVVMQPETRACERPARDGASCGGLWDRCCGGECIDLAGNADHCGACRVDCGTLGCGQVGDGFACAGCAATTTCQGIYNESATCYLSGGAHCNCQCPGGRGICADGGCGEGFYCHSVPGHNFCSPSPT